MQELEVQVPEAQVPEELVQEEGAGPELVQELGAQPEVRVQLELQLVRVIAAAAWPSSPFPLRISPHCVLRNGGGPSFCCIHDLPLSLLSICFSFADIQHIPDTYV